MNGDPTRRAFLGGLGAVAMATAVPARARSGTLFDRETLELHPSPDSGIIANAFNSLVRRLSDGGGGTLRLSAGIFPTDQQLYLLDNVRIAGAGQERSILHLAAYAPPFGESAGILRAKRPNVPLPERFVGNVVMEHFTIDGNRANQRDDVYDQEKKYGFYGETRDAVMRFVTIRDCMGYGFDPHGAFDDAPSERMIIEDCHAHGNLKDGFTLDRQVDMVFRRNLAENNDRAGVNIVTGTFRTTIADNVVRDNGGVGVMVQNGSRTLDIHSNDIEGNALEGVYLRDASAIGITGNRISGNGRAGIRVRGGHSVNITSNRVGENLVDPQSGQSEIHLDAYKGVGATNVLVEDNMIRATRNGALWEGNGAHGNRIVNNVFATRADGIRLGPDGSEAAGNVERLF